MNNIFLPRRFLNKQERESRRRINFPKKKVDDECPTAYMHMFLKLKRLQQIEDGNLVIQQQNRRLSERILRQMVSRSQIDNHYISVRGIKDMKLGLIRRQRHLMKTTLENQALLKKIATVKSEYNKEKLEIEYQKFKRIYFRKSNRGYGPYCGSFRIRNPPGCNNLRFQCPNPNLNVNDSSDEDADRPQPSGFAPNTQVLQNLILHKLISEEQSKSDTESLADSEVGDSFVTSELESTEGMTDNPKESFLPRIMQQKAREILRARYQQFKSEEEEVEKADAELSQSEEEEDEDEGEDEEGEDEGEEDEEEVVQLPCIPNIKPRARMTYQQRKDARQAEKLAASMANVERMMKDIELVQEEPMHPSPMDDTDEEEKIDEASLSSSSETNQKSDESITKVSTENQTKPDKKITKSILVSARNKQCTSYGDLSEVGSVRSKKSIKFNLYASVAQSDWDSSKVRSDGSVQLKFPTSDDGEKSGGISQSNGRNQSTFNSPESFKMRPVNKTPHQRAIDAARARTLARIRANESCNAKRATLISDRSSAANAPTRSTIRSVITPTLEPSRSSSVVKVSKWSRNGSSANSLPEDDTRYTGSSYLTDQY